MITAQDSVPSSLPPVGLLRRFAAIFYDSLLLFSVLFFATGLFNALISADSSTHPILQIYLLIVSFFYFAGFWRRGGQTLGMMAWQIQVQSLEGYTVTWWQMVQRFVMAIISWSIFGLGFFWALWDKEGRTWHDRASRTQLVRRTN